ncbi:MAG TPA: OsmC family protein [bacterium]|nr:OsmC family protein [bacterium]
MKDVVEVSFHAEKSVTGSLNGHKICTSYPDERGGDGSAPNPFELFLISLGTCAGYYARTYCEEHHLASESLRIYQHNVFEEKTGKLLGVRMQVLMPPDFPEQHKAPLKRAIDSCKVKQVLVDPVLMHVELMEMQLENANHSDSVGCGCGCAAI